MVYEKIKKIPKMVHGYRNGIWKNRENTRNGTHIPKMVYEKNRKIPEMVYTNYRIKPEQ